MSNKRKTLASCPCADCGWLTVHHKRPSEWYMVKDPVWLAAGMQFCSCLEPEHNNEYLCIGCLERRLGRQLTANDFNAVNIPGPQNTARLNNRLAGGKADAQ